MVPPCHPSKSSSTSLLIVPQVLRRASVRTFGNAFPDVFRLRNYWGGAGSFFICVHVVMDANHVNVELVW